MSTPLLRVENSPFGQQQVELLNRLLPALTSEQSVWLSGYLAGMRAQGGGAVVEASAAESVETGNGHAVDGPAVTVLYGSQTGNAVRLAGQMAQRLSAQGFQTTLSCMSEFRASSLKKIQHLLVVVSTHGEGEPPDKAKPFYEFLFSKRAPKLDDARYSVLALGDISYK